MAAPWEIAVSLFVLFIVLVTFGLGTYFLLSLRNKG